MSRIYFIDALKTLAIFLVCYYHVSRVGYDIFDGRVLSYLNYFLHGAASFAVPLFFMISGYLLLPRAIDLKKHAYRTGKIYVLTLLWSAFFVMASIYLRDAQYSPVTFIKTTMFIKPGINNTLWFLFALVSVYILFPLTKLAFDQENKNILYWMLGTLFVFSFASHAANWLWNALVFMRGHHVPEIKEKVFFNLQDVVPFASYFYANVYFIIGGLLKDKVKTPLSSPALGGLIFFSLTALCIYGVMLSRITGSIQDTVFPEYYSIPTFIGTTSIFILFMRHWNSGNKLVASIGFNSLGIYLVHGTLSSVFRKYIMPSYAEYETAALNYVYTTLLVLLSLAIVMALRRIPVAKELVRI